MEKITCFLVPYITKRNNGCNFNITPNVHTHTCTYTLYCNPGAASPLQVYDKDVHVHVDKKAIQ